MGLPLLIGLWSPRRIFEFNEGKQIWENIRKESEKRGKELVMEKDAVIACHFKGHPFSPCKVCNSINHVGMVSGQ